MALIPYISGGETPTASLMNSIFEEADRKLSLALSDHSIFFWPGWPGGSGFTRFVGPMFFFINGAPSVYNHIWRDDYLAYGTGNNYNHDIFTAAVASCPFVPGYEDSVINARILDEVSSATGPLIAALNNQEFQTTPFSRCLGALKKDGFNLFTNAPFMFCPIRWAQAELVFEGHTSYVIPKEWNRFNFFRIHNLSADSMTVSFEGQPDYGDGHSIEIPGYGSKCVRRTMKVGSEGAWSWMDGWNHFHKFREGDPRFWTHHFPNSFAVPPSSTAYTNNNVTNPGRIFDLFHRMSVTHPLGSGLMVFDERKFWDANTHFSQTSTIEGAVPAPVNDADQDRGYYGSVGNGSNLLADILFSRGAVGTVKMEADVTQGDVVQGTTAEHQESVFMGVHGVENEWSNFVNGLENVTMTIQGDGSLLIQKAAGVGNVDLDIVSIGCNMIMQALGGTRFAHALSAFPYVSNPIFRKNKAGDVTLKSGILQQCRVNNPSGSQWDDIGVGASGQLVIPALSHPTVNAHRSYALRTVTQLEVGHDIPYGYTATYGVSRQPTVATASEQPNPLLYSQLVNPNRTPQSTGVGVFKDTVGDLLTMENFGHSTNGSPAYDVELRMTAFGPLLLFNESLSLPDPLQSVILDARAGGDYESWSAGHLKKLVYNLGEKYFPTWYSSGDINLSGFNYPRFRRVVSKRSRTFSGILWEYIDDVLSSEVAVQIKGPRWSHDAFIRGETNSAFFEDDKLSRVAIYQNRSFHLPGALVYATGLGSWLLGESGVFSRPDDNPLLLTKTNQTIWYSQMRASILANNSFDQTVSGVSLGSSSEGFSWSRSTLFNLLLHTLGDYHLPLAAEHYNALASVVNSCVRVKPLSLNDFVGLSDSAPLELTPGLNKLLVYDKEFFKAFTLSDTGLGASSTPAYAEWWSARGIPIRGDADITIVHNGTQKTLEDSVTPMLRAVLTFTDPPIYSAPFDPARATLTHTTEDTGTDGMELFDRYLFIRYSDADGMFGLPLVVKRVSAAIIPWFQDADPTITRNDASNLLNVTGILGPIRGGPSTPQQSLTPFTRYFELQDGNPTCISPFNGSEFLSKLQDPATLGELSVTGGEWAVGVFDIQYQDHLSLFPVEFAIDYSSLFYLNGDGSYNQGVRPAFRQEEGQERNFFLQVDAINCSCIVTKTPVDLWNRLPPSSDEEKLAAHMTALASCQLDLEPNPSSSPVIETVSGPTVISSTHCDRVRFVFDDTISAE